MPLSVEELHDRALALSKENNDDNFWELAKLLRQLHGRDRDQYQNVLEKSGLHTRKAYYLIEIHEAFDPLQVSRAKLKQVGWTKLKELTKVVTQENADEYLELAANHNLQQLKGLLRGEKPKTNHRVLQVYFAPKEYEELEEAMLANGAKRSGLGLIDKDVALIRIVRKLKQVAL